MQATVAAIYRHPVKSLGEEALQAVSLTAGRHLPMDRVWAIAHGASLFSEDNPEWVRARSFVTQTFVPRLAQISISYDDASGTLSLSHPDLEEITADPETPEGAAALANWVAPLAEGCRQGPYRLCRLPDGALTDFKDTHVAINSLASLRALSEAAGRDLEHIRFRGNFWLDGLAPWEEFDLLDKEVQIGSARLKVVDRVVRCNATTASPRTGNRDVPVPQILMDRWGHQEFGVYAQVVGGGEVRLGDPVRPA